MISEEYYYLNIGRASDLKDAKERRLYRLFEILPGALSWGTLAVLAFLSWLTPVAVAFFIIAFDVYWLLKTIFLSLHLRSGFKAMRANLTVDWFEKLKQEKRGWEEYRHLIILPVYREGWEVVEPTLAALVDARYPKEKMLVVLALEERAGD